MKLIREEIESVDFIVEERNGKKSMYIEGIFLQGDIQNRNGRMYPIDTLRKEVQRYNESNIVTGRAINAKRTFENLFELGFIPVVNENDRCVQQC